MKKIIFLSFALFFAINSNLNAQDFNEYNKIYHNKNANTLYKKNTPLFIKNQRNSNEFKEIKKLYLETENSSEIAVKKPNKEENKVITTTTTSTEEELIAIRRKKIKSRTVGNYLGIDFINTGLRYRNIGYYNEEEKLGPVSDYTTPKYKNSFGLKYFYALNYRGFYIAPEIFFEYNNIKKHFDGDNFFERQHINQRNPLRFGYKFLKIHRTYGGKINFGYDITPNFAPFVFTGISKIYYSALDSIYPKRIYFDENNSDDFRDVQNYLQENGQINPFSVIHKSKLAPFFGFGAKIKITDRFLLNAEYLIYDLRLKSNSQGQKNPNVNTYQMGTQNSSDFNDFEASLRIAKVGLLYNF